MLQPLKFVRTIAGHRVQDGDDRGATSAEYALMTSFIAVAIFSSVLALGSKISEVFTATAGGI